MICLLCGTREAGPDEHLCDECERESDKALDLIDRLVEQGHTFQCAFRQVWDDGLCECDWGRWYEGIMFTTA